MTSLATAALTPAVPSEKRVHANGLEHHVLMWQPEASVDAKGTALLLHGFMDAAGTWDLVAPRLTAAGLRVIAPHMRGFGDGPRAPSGSYYHFPDYVADVMALVDALLAPEEPLFLVGHSMGGTVASYCAGACPERIAKLALLEGIGPPDNPHEAAPIRMRAWLDGLRAARSKETKEAKVASTGDALRRLAMNHPNVDLDLLATRVPHLIRATEDGFAWRYDPLHRTTAPMPFYAKGFTEFAKRVTAPVLFVSGGASGFHPPDEDERVAQFPRARRLVLEGAGHMIHWTQPAPLADALVQFWTDANE